MEQQKQLVNSEDLLAWLNEAYGMELAMAGFLETQIRDADDYPEHRERLEEHLAETRGHAEELRAYIEKQGGMAFDGASSLRGVFGHSQCVASGMADDEIMRCLMCEYAAEHFEIACYRSLKAAALELDQPELGEMCDRILRQEEAMAGWIGVQIPLVTQHYLRSKPAGWL